MIDSEISFLPMSDSPERSRSGPPNSQIQIIAGGRPTSRDWECPRASAYRLMHLIEDCGKPSSEQT